jgi:hypothetical protein
MSPQFQQQNPHDWDWEKHPERWIRHRARYLERKTDFDSVNCQIIAAAELGCSRHGIADHADVGVSTVKSRMGDLDAVDHTLLLTRRPDEIRVESPVGIEGTAFGGDE